MTVEKDFKEGDWILSKGHQHFGFSISSTWILDGITWCGKVVCGACCSSAIFPQSWKWKCNT